MAETAAEEKKEQESGNSVFRSVYDDTIYFVDGIVEEYSMFPTILEMMRRGNASIELRKRYMLRAIDETWVDFIEDSLPSLDMIIRNPSRFIEEQEELLPVEMSRKISVRTLQHLSQHTNLISSVDGDMIVPKKLLNVFREETIQTYENKFVNTLINRLYAFVNRRYEIALKTGHDEKTTSIEFKEDFDHDKIKVKMNFRVEISEPHDGSEKIEKNYSYTTELWKRVERLNNIVTNYASSEFVQNMGRSYIRPPVMRTNAIMKNKNLYRCYLLWQFIETYDSAGYSMLVQEDLENVDEGYIKELYSTLALQYMIFRYNIHNEFEEDSTLASKLTNDELHPRIIDELKSLSDRDFDVTDPPPERVVRSSAEARYGILTPEDKILLQSIDLALNAVDEIGKKGDEEYYSGGPIPEPEPEPEPQPEKEFVPAGAQASAEPSDSETDAQGGAEETAGESAADTGAEDAAPAAAAAETETAPTEEQPTEEPSEDQPADEQPVEEHPADEQPGENDPGEPENETAAPEESSEDERTMRLEPQDDE